MNGIGLDAFDYTHTYKSVNHLKDLQQLTFDCDLISLHLCLKKFCTIKISEE